MASDDELDNDLSRALALSMHEVRFRCIEFCYDISSNLHDIDEWKPLFVSQKGYR